MTAVAVNAAFFAGKFATRGSKLGEPFEYTRSQMWLTYGATLASLLVNVAVLNGFPANLLPPMFVELGNVVQRVLAIIGLVGTVFGAVLSGAMDAFKWAVIEEVQRKNVAARKVVDAIERRTQVQ
jgi:hypothetical protein